MDWRKYSDHDFRQIAASIGVCASRICQHRHSFESAATWYRSDLRAPNRVPPSTIKRRARLIVAAARKLLQHLQARKGYADNGMASVQVSGVRPQRGLGTSIVQALAHQLGAIVEQSGGPEGTTGLNCCDRRRLICRAFPLYRAPWLSMGVRYGSSPTS
jgi:hypothetical protein